MIRKHLKMVLWTLVALTTFSTSMVFAAEKAKGNKIDRRDITPEAVAAIVIHPARILTAVKAEKLTTESVTAMGMKHLGIDPADVEQAVAVVEIVEGEPRFGVVLHLAKAVDQQKLFPEIMAKAPEEAAISFSNDKTLILAHEIMLKKISENQLTPKEGKVSKILQGLSPLPDAIAIVQITPIRPMLAKQLQTAPIPAELKDVKKLPDLLTSVGIKAKASGDMPAEISLKANNESDAEQVERILVMLLDAAKKQAKVEIAKKVADSEPKEKEMIEKQGQVTEKILDSLRPSRKGAIVTISVNLYNNLGVIGVSH